MRLNDTKKSFPIVIDQITEAHNLLDALLKQFSSERGTDKKKDIESFDQMIDYQNRINSRLGKLWIIYKKEVEQYHIDKRLPGSDGPDSNDAGDDDSDISSVGSNDSDNSSVGSNDSGNDSDSSSDSGNDSVGGDSDYDHEADRLNNTYDIEADQMYLASNSYTPPAVNPDPRFIPVYKDSYYVVLSNQSEDGFVFAHPYGIPTMEGLVHASYFDPSTKRDPALGTGKIYMIRPDYSYEAIEDLNEPEYLPLIKGERYIVLTDINPYGEFLGKQVGTDVEGMINKKSLDPKTEKNYNVERYAGKYYMALEDFPAEFDGQMNVEAGVNYYLLEILENGWGLVTDGESNMATIPLDFLNEVGVDPIEQKVTPIKGFTYLYFGNPEGMFVKYNGDNEYYVYDDDTTMMIYDTKALMEIEADDTAIVIKANEPGPDQTDIDDFNYNNELLTSVGDKIVILDYSYDEDGDFKDSEFLYAENLNNGKVGWVPVNTLKYQRVDKNDDRMSFKSDDSNDWEF